MTSLGARSERAPADARPAVRSPSDGGDRTVSTWWAWALVAAAVVWGLVSLRAVLIGVPYLNDSSMHEQLVRVATAQWRAGHLPLTTWFPYLGEGSPDFLHYQSLPAMVAGAIGLVTGPDIAFRWTLYLLLASWPISIYIAARAFGAGRGAAAASAAMSPFLWSASGVGYEQHAYVWIGYGVWTQLWAMWTLPLAWGFSWRAIRDGRGYLRAVFFTALTACLHFETGYLALAVLIVWPLVAGRPLLTRIRRAALLLAGSLLSAAWAVVPLLAQRNWAGVNQPLQGTSLVNGYGAHQVLVWLLRGELLDNGRLPVITVLAAIGFSLAWLNWSSDLNGRALLLALGLALVLSFGRTTFGSLVNIIPGGHDIFFRRFMMGIQLAGLLLAGRGAAGLARMCERLLIPRIPGWRPVLTPVLGLAAAVGVLAPAWHELDFYDHQDTGAIHGQRSADHTNGAEVDRLIAVIRRDGGGRTYAGMPSNWGASFTVGQVPVFKYLESRDVDEVGYTLRTASLMTNPEYYFDQSNPADYRLFGIRYLIYPAGETPPVAARRLARSGPYALWSLPGDGYIQVGRTVGQIAANRTDLGTHNIALLQSALASDGDYVNIDYGSDAKAAGRLPSASTRSPAGTVTAQHADLLDGVANATVHMRTPGVAVLSASYDPGWQATDDGRPVATRMVAPALVAISLPAGTAHIIFRYHGYRSYPWLFALAALTLLATGLTPRVIAARARSRATAEPGQPPAAGPIP